MTSERARQLLDRERERIERALAAAASGREDQDELSQLDNHPADYATELYDRELEEGTVEHLREELEAIERAYKRLEDGTYGLSIESGKPIPDARSSWSHGPSAPPRSRRATSASLRTLLRGGRSPSGNARVLRRARAPRPPGTVRRGSRRARCCR